MAGQLGTPTATSQTEAQNGEDTTALKAWWMGFKRKGKKDSAPGLLSCAVATTLESLLTQVVAPIVEAPSHIFGVDLQTSIKYANVAISLTNEHGESFIYGYVPIVVAKCGVFLKEKGEIISDGCFLPAILTLSSH